MRTALKLTFALAALAVVAGCGNDKSGPNPMVAAVGAMAKQSMAKVSGKKPDAPQTQAKAASPADLRAQLAAAKQPVLLVASETLGRTGFVGIVDAKGDVVTWETPDGASFSLRNGVLIQTRGLGADLMSAEAPSVAQLSGEASYQRLYFFLGADDQGTRRTYDCKATIVGKESIDVLAKTHQTLHVTELCERSLGKVTNDYWIEGTTIRQSRQWASSGIGYLQFQRIID